MSLPADSTPWSSSQVTAPLALSSSPAQALAGTSIDTARTPQIFFMVTPYGWIAFVPTEDTPETARRTGPEAKMPTHRRHRPDHRPPGAGCSGHHARTPHHHPF